MRHTLLTLAALTILLGGCITEQEAAFDKDPIAGTSLAATDRAFLMDAASTGLAEVELGTLAAERAADEQVKAFARQMIADHTRLNRQVAELAQQHQIELPASLSPKDLKNKSELTRLSGQEFDRRYVADQVKDHVAVVSRYETHAEKGENPELKTLAQEALPTLRQHLQHAQALSEQLTAK